MTDASRIEFDRQTERLVELGLPALAGISEEDLRALVAPLADRLPEPSVPREGHAPFVIVLTRELVDPCAAVPLLRLMGARGLGSKPGIVDRNHGEGDLATYHPLEELGVPEAKAYLLVDVERGEEFCDVRPEDALPVIRGRGRTPLTIDEGIALVMQAPHLLEKNKCFMLSGSRRSDRRVPALWISENAPKLGWCWDGNPHTWLGVASAGQRRH
ncbi:hypothetical protein BJ980_002560 [Nocardioides daedukensis]|uniref:Uncharacterized protein n=1 Tax=Nocardioides daedukensis TaxID=634462 RepID=A0A7Y9UQU2_9ACTN|nr:DUF5701 family protein [Nocardioides daedukensis]NYG59637.1 hypothetical protein [Nocardioides daedukensis]